MRDLTWRSATISSSARSILQRLQDADPRAKVNWSWLVAGGRLVKVKVVWNRFEIFGLTVEAASPKKIMWLYTEFTVSFITLLPELSHIMEENQIKSLLAVVTCSKMCSHVGEWFLSIVMWHIQKRSKLALKKGQFLKQGKACFHYVLLSQLTEHKACQMTGKTSNRLCVGCTSSLCHPNSNCLDEKSPCMIGDWNGEKKGTYFEIE
jgi:hypothetical protein